MHGLEDYITHIESLKAMGGLMKAVRMIPGGEGITTTEIQERENYN